MNKINHCSSCGSNEWKTAKMVMLEGVAYSDGSLIGETTERGSFGSVRDFFLSDRWFDFAKYSSTGSIGG